MKKIILSLALISFSANVFSQLVLPQPSPKAVVTQTVGLTDITIEYSSPGVKGRVIFGGLEAYDSLWRAGANAATKITFSKDVTIEGVAVAKGSYSIFIIPSKAADWTIVINKNAAASTGDYKKSEDVVRVKAKPQEVPLRERLLYTISNFTNESASVDMEWEKTRVSFTVKLDTDKQAVDNINNTLNGTWRMYANSARYMLDTKKDYDSGMKYIDQSIVLKEDWYNVWIKAQLQSAKGMKADAYKSALKAKELGDKSANFFFKSDVEKALKEWAQK